MFPEYNSLTSFYLSQISSLQTVKLYIWNLLFCFQDCISTPSSWIPNSLKAESSLGNTTSGFTLYLVCSHVILSLIINSTNRSWVLQNRCMQFPKSDRHVLKVSLLSWISKERGQVRSFHRYQFLFFLPQGIIWGFLSFPISLRNSFENQKYNWYNDLQD